jgi:protein SCO1/2
VPRLEVDDAVRKNDAQRILCVRFVSLALLASFVLLSACTGAKPKQHEGRQYPIEGKVIAVDGAHQQITLAHKDIPGLMKGMTMPFRVRDTWVFNVAQPGDELHGTLVVTPDEGYIEKVSVNKAPQAAAVSATSSVRVPAIGDSVPDFSFVDQDGRRLSLHKLHGRPVLLTFIYTRCPLPDFCIRMSNNFAELVRQLKQSDPALFRHLLLMSISIDPEYDTPAVLKRYGANYAGAVDPGFEHWKFVSTNVSDTRKAADFFGLSYNREGGQIVHSLRTVLLAPDGTIAAQFTGNNWTPAEMEAELKKLAAHVAG